MSDGFKQGDAILFMKVGTHADEDIDHIIDRKQAEIDDVGYTLWGYGGNSCHPLTMVQPFVKASEREGKPVRLVMQKMDSRHFAVTQRAEEMSRDGVNWEEIPEGIDVIGSRFALAIAGLEAVDAELPLAYAEVAHGKQLGRPGDEYIKGHVDKAVLTISEDVPPNPDPDRDGKIVRVSLAAALVDPYAVFVRN